MVLRIVPTDKSTQDWSVKVTNSLSVYVCERKVIHNMWTKNTNFEVAVQVLLFISAPGFHNAQTTSKLVDLLPTIVELAELPSIPPCG